MVPPWVTQGYKLKVVFLAAPGPKDIISLFIDRIGGDTEPGMPQQLVVESQQQLINVMTSFGCKGFRKRCNVPGKSSALISMFTSLNPGKSISIGLPVTSDFTRL